MTLTCYCCGETYERGQFRCCAPPQNMRSDVWLGQHCIACRPMPTSTRCPRHCTCDTITPRVATVRPLAELAKQAAASLLPPAERLRHLSLDRNEKITPAAREYLPHPDD